jgi:MFS family permease
MFRALRHRNFLLFWLGALLSNTGTWMQIVAQGWLVLSLTDSPFWLGADAFLATAPGIVLTLLGGVLADLISRQRLLIYTQAIAGLAALALVPLIYNGSISLTVILLASFVTGCCMSLSSPSYQAITIDLVGREDLANAIALNSTQFQLSRVVGPAIAGITISVLGLAGCFLVNGISYVLIVGALLLVRFPAVTKTYEAKRAFFVGEPARGRRVCVEPRALARDARDSSVVSLFGAPYISLLAVFARDVYGLGEGGLALMMGTAGAGALAGALALTLRGDFHHKAQAVVIGAMAFGVSMIAFASAGELIFALTMLFLMGLTITVSVATTNTLLQQLVSDEMRGRVMSLFVLSFLGTSPFGNLFAGWLASRRGAPVTLAIFGACVIVFVLLISLRTRKLWDRASVAA